MKDLFKLIRAAVWLAFFGALYQELRRPPGERTWHGKVAGVVPYDFRIPTITALREAYWAPERDVIFTEKVVGVGWAVNLPVAARKLSATVRQYAGSTRDARSGRPDRPDRPDRPGSPPA